MASRAKHNHVPEQLLQRNLLQELKELPEVRPVKFAQRCIMLPCVALQQHESVLLLVAMPCLKLLGGAALERAEFNQVGVDWSHERPQAFSRVHDRV